MNRFLFAFHHSFSQSPVLPAVPTKATGSLLSNLMTGLILSGYVGICFTNS